MIDRLRGFFSAAWEHAWSVRVAGPTAVALGIGASIAALIVRLPLIPQIGADYPFATFFAGVAVAAWAGGFPAGITATAVSALLAAVFVLSPVGSVAVDQPPALLVFALTGALIAAVGGHLHRALRSTHLAHARARLLADASDLLGRQVGREQVLDVLVEAAVPSLADGAVVALLEGDGGLAIRRTRPPGAIPGGLPHSLVTVAMAGGASLVTHVDRLPAGDELHELAARGTGSLIAVPLADGSRAAIGVFLLLRHRRHPAFNDEDLETARQLAARAGIAIRQIGLFTTMRARAHELRAVIDAIEDPVVVADPAGAIASANRAAREVFGPLLEGTFDDVLGSLRAAEGSGQARQVGASARYVVPVILEADRGGHESRIAIFRDVTEVLETEAARDAFVGMLSHELRTPITTIYGATRVLLRQQAADAAPSLVGDVAAEADRLYRLVEDLLVLSRFERGRLDIAPEPILVHRILPGIVQREAARSPDLRVELDVPPALPAVLADPTYVEQIVRNLLTNAAKYAGSAAKVVIRARDDGDTLAIDVDDDGPGIAPADREQVFALYERLSQPGGRRIQGSGIGLFVCRRLVETMGGSMRVEDSPIGGARFTFTLPVVTAQSMGSAAGAGAAGVGAGAGAGAGASAGAAAAGPPRPRADSTSQ